MAALLRSGPEHVGAFGNWSWLKAWAMKIATHRGMKKVIVALARRLAVIMHRVWVDGNRVPVDQGDRSGNRDHPGRKPHREHHRLRVPPRWQRYARSNDWRTYYPDI